MRPDHEKFFLRELCWSDLRQGSGIWETLNELTPANCVVSLRARLKIWLNLKREGSFVLVAIWRENGQIVGHVKLLPDQKIARGGALAGHVEDVVTRQGFRNQGVASALLKELKREAILRGMYKLTLACHDWLEGFYARFDFVKTDSGMRANL
ncbi:MAG: GNAT family N-acetyltransferase [Patescibacteria group bacterium]|nr:GNAT family N-acetyltransferase [Patescibacteria group bacterium]MDD4610932.1 GNAT family N-acetyltransferase [Patescibacteria group bacterium]